MVIFILQIMFQARYSVLRLLLHILIDAEEAAKHIPLYSARRRMRPDVQNRGAVINQAAKLLVRCSPLIVVAIHTAISLLYQLTALLTLRFVLGTPAALGGRFPDLARSMTAGRRQKTLLLSKLHQILLEVDEFKEAFDFHISNFRNMK